MFILPQTLFMHVCLCTYFTDEAVFQLQMGPVTSCAAWSVSNIYCSNVFYVGSLGVCSS